MKTRSSSFKSRAVLNLCESVGTDNPLHAVRHTAGLMTKELALETPPFFPCRYAAIRGVRKVIVADMALDGRLVFSSGGFEIYVRSSHSEGRQNFTIAHETAHTFFLESSAESPLDKPESGIGYFTDSDDEEFLCDVAAAEMLMPEAYIRERLFAYGPSVRSVFRIAEEFKVSLHAAARRIREVGPWKVLVTRWKCKGDRLEPVWSYGSKVLWLRMFEWALEPTGPIRRSLQDGYAVGRETLRLPTSTEKYFVESKRMCDGLLSALIAEKHPEYLLPMFDRASTPRQQVMWS